VTKRGATRTATVEWPFCCGTDSGARSSMRLMGPAARFHRAATGSGIRVIWQYVVFRWNDRDDQFRRAIAMAEKLGIQIYFDFAHTWGRSRRRPDDLRYLTPYLKPFTALPGEPRQDGW
jgi:hypothetical protein